MLLDDRIDQALARSRRSNEPFALFVVDLDGFKGVNDVRGHEAGNDVLRAIARRCSPSCAQPTRSRGSAATSS